MDSAFCYILAISFWVLAALAVVCMIVWVFCYVQYYRWEKQEREQTNLVSTIQESIKKALADIENSDHDTYGDIENDKEAESCMMQDY